MILVKGVPMTKYWSQDEIESEYDWITDVTMALFILEAEKSERESIIRQVEGVDSIPIP